MRFLIDNDKHVVFGYTGKCGGTHVKSLFRYLRSTDDFELYMKKLPRNYHGYHTKDTFNKLPQDISKLKIIIFTRNPYERLVSGFLHQYNKNGICRGKWNINKDLTFDNFVEETIKGDFKKIDREHFTHQVSEAYEDRILSHKDFLVYDIKNIDYDYLGKLFDKSIPDEIKNIKGNHCYSDIKLNEVEDYEICYKKLDDYYSIKKIKYKCFYTSYLKKKVYEFYKKDFEFCEKNGITYDI